MTSSRAVAVDLPTIARTPSAAINIVLAVVGLLGIAVPALIVAYAPPARSRAVVKTVPHRIVPKAELPPVEPLRYQNLAPDDARSFNATIPFVTGPNPRARPFRLSGTPEEQARALDCMAAAMLYEAGDDTVGQRSVAQVIINRVRHPAFPKTICGVIFQGQERSTGCQFTFTCDGALARNRWSDAAWKRARETSALMLGGGVYAPVGHSTHYHTDWVVPYWSSSLDKVAEVKTHLFFRWTGWWGTPPAFNRRVSSDEPVIRKLAAFSDAHNMAVALAEAGAAVREAEVIAGLIPPPLPADPNSFLLTLDPRMPADNFAALAARTCGDRAYCKVMAWTDGTKTPGALPLGQTQIASMSFSYLRDRARGYDKALWNCGEFRRVDFSQCMKVQVIAPVPPRPADGFKLENLPGARVTPPPVTTTLKPTADGLTGVRRVVPEATDR